MPNGAAAPAADAGQAAGSAEYRTILPALPSGPRLATTVFLHGDTRGRPYKTQDFADGLEEAIGMAHVVGLGAFQYNHVWVCTMDSRESKEKLVAAKELVIKGKRCLVIDPNVTEVGIRIHWLPTFVTDGEIRKAFEDYGTIVKISREMWKSPSGNYEVETSTRSATIVLKEGTTKDELPDQASVSLYPVLVSVPGRPPRCLRCNQLGHMRRQCRAPWCRQCRSYGHGEAECVPTYAAKTRRHADEARDNDLLDDGESTECGTNTRPLNLPPAEPQESPSSTNTAQREAETEGIPQESGAEEMEKEKEHPNGEKEGSDGASAASIGTEGTQETDNSLTERKVPGSAPEKSLGSGPPARTAAPMEESQPRREGAALKDTARTTRSSLRNPTKKTEQGSLLGPGDERVVA